MTHLIQFLFSLIASSARTRLSLQLEVAALRHQLSVYRAERRKPQISSSDRLLWSLVSKWWSGWRKALYFVQPRTVVAWQKQRFRDYWRVLSQHGRPGRPKIAPELRQLIKRMWRANPMWGSPRIVSELKMLGIDIAKSTVERYKPWHRQKWTPLIGQRGSVLKVESDNIIMLTVRAVLCPRKPHSVFDLSGSSEAARDYSTRSRCSVSPLRLSGHRMHSGKRIRISMSATAAR